MAIIDINNLKIDGKLIKIEHTSPLSMAQDEEELVNMNRFVENIVNLFGPEQLSMLVKADEYVKRSAELLNVKSDISYNKEEAMQIKQNMADMMQDNPEILNQ